jgi:DNA polymerase III delta prime subunit
MELIEFQRQFIPNTITETLLHQDKIKLISNMKSIPNVIFYGHEGKTILIQLLIKNIYKDYKLKKFEFKVDKNIFKCFHSNYHIELDIVYLNNKERKSVLDLVKEYSMTKSIINIPYKIIVIYNFDKLSQKVQFQFRSTMEKVFTNVRFILHVKEFTNVISPIRSRCLSIRIPSVKRCEISKLIKIIIKKYDYKINKLDPFIDDCSDNGIIYISKIFNLLFLKLELNTVKMRYKIKHNVGLHDLYKTLISKKNPFDKIKLCKDILIELIQKNTSFINIYKFLLSSIIDDKNISDDDKTAIIKKTAYYEHMKSREIMNLEAYLVYLILVITD